MKINLFKWNNKGAGNLTYLVIALGLFILLLTLSTNVYIDIMSNNGGTIDSSYLAKYAEIQNYNSNLSDFATTVSNKNLWLSIPNGIASTFNAFIIGVGGVATFFSFIDIIPAFLSTISNIPGLGMIGSVISFLIFAITIYVAIMAYRAIRNSAEVP